MVSVEGLRFGKTAVRARSQSTKGLASWVSQNSRSSRRPRSVAGRYPSDRTRSIAPQHRSVSGRPQPRRAAPERPALLQSVRPGGASSPSICTRGAAKPLRSVKTERRTSQRPVRTPAAVSHAQRPRSARRRQTRETPRGTAVGGIVGGGEGPWSSAWPDEAMSARPPLPAENLAPCLRPRDRRHRARIQLVNASGDLRGPGGLCTLVGFPLKALQERGRQGCPCLWSQLQRFLQELRGISCHGPILLRLPVCSLQSSRLLVESERCRADARESGGPARP